MRRKGVDEAWNALEDMQRQGLTTDRFTISRMLMKTVGDGRGRANSAKVYRGVALVERFIRMQPDEADEVLFNALLDTCCRMKDLGRLEATAHRMQELQIQPSHVTLGILVKAYGQAGDISRVLKVWDEMAEQRRQANAVTYGCMIDACVRCGHMEKAVEIFKDMKRRRKHRNTILYTTLIKGYGQAKDLPNALALFKEMKEEGVPYNTITYNSIIDVCIKCSDVANSEILLREMMAPGSDLEPDLITYSTLLKGYCHVGDLDKALQVAETIRACGLRCDELVYNTLMDGCVKANDLSAGIGLFAEMAQSGMMPSSITHSIMVRLYQRNGYKGDAFEAVAQLYEHHGLDRPSASSERQKGGRRGKKNHARNHDGGGDAGSRNAAAADRGGCGAGDYQAVGGPMRPGLDPSMMPPYRDTPDMGGFGVGGPHPAAFQGDLSYMPPDMCYRPPFPGASGSDMPPFGVQQAYGMPPMASRGCPPGARPLVLPTMPPPTWGMPPGPPGQAGTSAPPPLGNILGTTAPSLRPPQLGPHPSGHPSAGFATENFYGGYPPRGGFDDLRGGAGMMPGPGHPLQGMPWGGPVDMQYPAAPPLPYGACAAYAADRQMDSTE